MSHEYDDGSHASEVALSQITGRPRGHAAFSAQKPEHYKVLTPEPIDVIAAWQLNFNLGNVVKYIARLERKGGLEDLKKALEYLSHEIKRRE